MNRQGGMQILDNFPNGYTYIYIYKQNGKKAQ